MISDTVEMVALVACLLFGSLFLAVAGHRIGSLRVHAMHLVRSISNKMSLNSFQQLVAVAVAVADRPRLPLLLYSLCAQRPPHHVLLHIALAGCSLSFVSRAWVYLPPPHRFLACVLIPLPHIFAGLCGRSTPSGPRISASTHFAHLFDYPPDYVLYHAPFAECRTCCRLKPARSKHCSLCGTCVARADHHCIWVNNCLGRGNYKFFLGLLLSLGIMLVYGVYLTCIILTPLLWEHMATLLEQHIHNDTEPLDAVGRIVLVSIQSMFQLLRAFYMMGVIPIAGVGLLAAVLAPLFARSLANHISLIRAGRTMNERNKWVEWELDIGDGLVFIGRLAERQDHDVGMRALMGTTETGEGEEEHRNIEERRERRGLQYGWPARSTQFLVRTVDGSPPRQLPPEIEELVVENSWQRCSEPASVENIYNLGFWKNLIEILRN